jgi:hypothetical protein
MYGNRAKLPIRTTVGLKNVNAAELRRLTITLPPLSRQCRIVSNLMMLDIYDRLEAQVTIHPNRK